jgi:trk system potassium uptake protein TrkH
VIAATGAARVPRVLDPRPVAYVVGLLICILGSTMLVPVALDLLNGHENGKDFLQCSVLSMAVGGLLAITCAGASREYLSRQQIFLMTTGVWAILPVFGALPFWIGTTAVPFVDAYFEAMSGMTTTGSTVLVGLEHLPQGLLLWRSMLQWFGGIGIIVVAMVFLPELRVGGMQIFRSEAFETEGKVLPRAAQIAAQISWIYLAITLAAIACYMALGMSTFDAVNHSLTTVSTGGFSTYDVSFGAFQGPAEYAASVFMVLACLPFVRYVQLVRGSPRPLLRDTQVHAFLGTIAVLVAMIMAYRIIVNGESLEPTLREGLFNVTSIISGTGYASVDYQLWGAFPAVMFFFIGLIGGCAGSTVCSVKIFRYQLLFASLKAQIRRIHSPNGLFVPRFKGKIVPEEVMSSVMSFFVLFILSLGLLAVALGMTGLDFVTSVSGAATAIANVGPGLGGQIGPAGNFKELNETAKWLLSFGMLLGRLELLTVLVILTPTFWRV